MESNYSLSDLKAVTDSANDFGGGSWWLIIILLFFFIGGNGFTNRNGELNTYASNAQAQDILFTQKFDAVGQKLNAIGDGICSSTYALNNAIHSAQDVTSSAVISEGRAIQTQLANCCCENQKNVDSLRFDMANYASAINSNIDSKFAQLEKAQLEQTIASQQNQINQLSLAQQMANVVKYPTTSAYCSGANPFCGGCGCAN